jgi:hypothetical protein
LLQRLDVPEAAHRGRLFFVLLSDASRGAAVRTSKNGGQQAAAHHCGYRLRDCIKPLLPLQLR